MDFPAEIIDLRPMILKLALTISRRHSRIDADDLIQCGIIAAMDCLRRFDASRGVPFSKFAAIRIYGAMKDEQRKSYLLSGSDRNRTEYPHELDYRETAAPIFSTFDPEPEWELIEEISLRLRNSLGERQSAIVAEYLFLGTPQKVIAEKYSISPSSVSVVVQRAFRILRERMEFERTK